MPKHARDNHFYWLRSTRNVKIPQKHKNKAQRFWDSVQWSDEANLELFRPMDHGCIWRRKNEAYAEKNTLPNVEAEACASLDLWSPPRLSFRTSPDLNLIENVWWDLKKVVAAQKPKSISELEAIGYKVWAKIPQECSQKCLENHTTNSKEHFRKNC